MSRARTLLSTTLLPVACATLTVLAAAGPAEAAALHATYDAAGTSTIQRTGSVVTLSPTTFTADLETDGTFTGSLPLNPASASFRILGLLPVSATVTFVPVGPVTGRLAASPRVTVTATAVYTITLSHVKVAGLPALVGSSCATASPVPITVATPAGQSFDIAGGGTVTGTYTIGRFAHCGLTTSLINALVPGPGNTATFTLSNGRFG